MIRFAQPMILAWLWALVPLALFFVWAYHRRQKRLQRFIQQNLVNQVASGYQPKRFRTKAIFLLSVFTFSILALARPQWGFEWQPVKREALDILIAIDTSKSMLTQDVRPNRLARAKLSIQDLLKKVNGDRIGIIAFAGDAFLVCPLTVDYSGVLLTMEDLDVNTISRGGTCIQAAIEVALKEYRDVPSQYKVLVILTDGENLEGDALSAAREARRAGIRIYTIGLGTREGELIQVEDVFGQKQFLKDQEGNFVKSRLNETLLQDLALSTNGIYIRASGAESGLDTVYDRELSRLEKREIESSMEKKYHDRFQYPLTLALLLLVVETCLTATSKKSSLPSSSR